MNAPKLDTRISVGNIITIITMTVGLLLGYQTTVSRVDANARGLSDVQQRQELLTTRLDRLIDAVNTERVNQTQLLTEMRVDIRYLRQAMDEFRQK